MKIFTLHWAWCGTSAKIKQPLLTSAFMIISSLISQLKKLTSVFILQLSQPEVVHRRADSQGPRGESNCKPERDSLLFRSQKTCMRKDQNQWNLFKYSKIPATKQNLLLRDQQHIGMCYTLKARWDTGKGSLLSSCTAQAGQHLFKIMEKHNSINYDYCDY